MGTASRRTGRRFRLSQKVQERALEGSESPFLTRSRQSLADNFTSSMAYMEMTLVLAALITELDMEFRDPQKEFKRGYTPTDSFVLLRPRVNIIAKRSRV